jgi:hypothetical protein
MAEKPTVQSASVRKPHGTGFAGVTCMSVMNATVDRLFQGGPPLKIEQLLGLVKPDDPGIARRAWIVALVSWGFLLGLSMVQEFLRHDGSLRSFLLDFGAHGRFLIAAPIFILAEGTCLPILGRMTRSFQDFGMVRDRDRERFDTAVRATRRLLNSTVAEVLAVVLAYLIAATMYVSVHIPSLPRWSVLPENPGASLSLAGLWQLWISLPLLLVLFIGWIWRQVLWCRLMWRIARFDLNLVAAHPDCAGGLKFLSATLWGYSPLAFALAATVACGVANQIRGGASIYDFRFVVAVLVVFVLAFFVAPFLVFTPVLRGLKSRGSYEYGTLSCVVGQQFEAKWIGEGDKDVQPEALALPDFSATTDLYAIASNVYQIGYVPLSAKAVGELLVFTLLPFVPVILMSVPLDTLLSDLKQILF